METRTKLYLALWVLLLSHTVLTRSLTQITLIDDAAHPAEHVLRAVDQSSRADHVAELSLQQINTSQVNATHGNLTALCLRCAPGEYATANCTSLKSIAAEAGRCAPGYCALSINCTRCPLGTYNTHYNASHCLLCAPGSYADRAGARNCSACGAGSYQPRNGSVACEPCGQGYYSDLRGAVSRASCQMCSAGWYCPAAETRAPAPCLPGWYCPSRALPGPVPCPAGRYCPAQRMTEPSSCPAGYYCATEGLTAPQPCPLNHYCLADTVAPEPCSLLFAAAVQQTECTPTVLFYVVLVVGGLFAVLFVLWIVIRAAQRVRASAETKRRTEYTKLIPEPIDGPRYSGL